MCAQKIHIWEEKYFLSVFFSSNNIGHKVIELKSAFKSFDVDSWFYSCCWMLPIIPHTQYECPSKKFHYFVLVAKRILFIVAYMCVRVFKKLYFGHNIGIGFVFKSFNHCYLTYMVKVPNFERKLFFFCFLDLLFCDLIWNCLYIFNIILLCILTWNLLSFEDKYFNC